MIFSFIFVRFEVKLLLLFAFFLCLPGCLHLLPVYTYFSSMYAINATYCCMEDKTSSGTTTCRTDELLPAPISRPGCVTTSCFNPRDSLFQSFSQEMIITFAPHFRLVTKLLNYISPQNHHEPLALVGLDLYLPSPFVYGYCSQLSICMTSFLSQLSLN